MWQWLVLSFIGLCAGLIISGGVVGLLIGLSIIPRYAGITHTARYILFYEDATMIGAVLGNIFYLFQLPLPLGTPFLILYGGLSGIFLGGWILALAEMADIIPIFSRRIKLSHGLPTAMLCVALGKIIGSLYYYFQGWS